ncbi:immunity 52 family protein [Burkholderia ubonensis]|uniref:immunity 52 family protein n=1 Tax=Burkholderia ubonensis TaxID=101571 RepID=UPI00092036A3|nr:immunity 52 family protein [Burkholderia ubonensis]OJA22878.1 hypothetical protein BGX87_28065 [Burkholderia ubonensis]
MASLLDDAIHILPGRQAYFFDVPGTDSAAALSVVLVTATETLGAPTEVRVVLTHPLRLPRTDYLNRDAVCTIIPDDGVSMIQWLVNGDSTVPAFDSTGPTLALTTSAKDDPSSPIQFADVWNGKEGQGAAGLMLKYRLNRPSGFDFRAIGISGLKSCNRVADLIDGALKIWPSLLVEVAPYAYSDEKVFPDRPGVGWMLYLPHVLTTVQIPEARALMPVTRDGQRQGTIIVSVTDGPFDVSNRAHVKVANDIEIRLADQDLLPRYVDL